MSVGLEMSAPLPLRVGIVGTGVIGSVLIKALVEGLEGLVLQAVSGRDLVAARARALSLGADVPACALDELVDQVDVVVDCAVAAAHLPIATAALSAGRIFMTMNSGALLAHEHLFDLAEERNARIIVPSGGVAGFDGLRAAALGTLKIVELVSRKPPESLIGAPHVVAQGFDLSNLEEPLLVFAGNAADAARLFPANANVAASLSLAGFGPIRTRVQIWADPGVTRISQEIHVVSAEAELRLAIFSNPMPDNPRTGSLTVLSAIEALRSIVSSCRVGS